MIGTEKWNADNKFRFPLFLLRAVVFPVRVVISLFFLFTFQLWFSFLILVLFGEFEFFSWSRIVFLWFAICFVYLIKRTLASICTCSCLYCYCWPAMSFLMCLLLLFVCHGKRKQQQQQRRHQKMIINEINERKACRTHKQKMSFIYFISFHFGRSARTLYRLY